MSEVQVIAEIEEMLMRRSLRRWKTAAWIVIGTVVSFTTILLLFNLLMLYKAYH